MGVSVDPLPSSRAFAEHCSVTKFALASDFHPKGEVAGRYGVYNEERGTARRSVFIIDENGILRWSKIYTEGIPDNEELLAELDKL